MIAKKDIELSFDGTSHHENKDDYYENKSNEEVIDEVSDILDYWIEDCYELINSTRGVFLEIHTGEIADQETEDDLQESFEELEIKGFKLIEITDRYYLVLIDR